MVRYTIEKEYEAMIEAYEKAGGAPDALQSTDIAKLVVHENKVLSTSEVPGVKLNYQPMENGIKAALEIAAGTKVERPIHLCFGVLPEEGLQEIIFHATIGQDAEASVIAHCVFPNAVHVIHKMDAEIEIGANARFSYTETHYHGDSGGIEVIPKAKVTIGENAIYNNTFNLTEGCVGKLDFEYDVLSSAGSIAEMTLKVYGKEDDNIRVNEKVNLNGENARSLIKTRVVLRDRAFAEIVGETHGNAPYARGHVDCTEIVNGSEAVARAIPIVSVTNEKAKVTHEAAIGSIDRRQIETLMARGLDEEEAVDVIVKGILR